jgi:predicted patatin/cPLA2 family phospholipase
MLLIILGFFQFVSSCRILVLSGGGAHGAFQAGVIKNLHDNGVKWDIITGVSAGALNAMALAIYNSSDQASGVSLMQNVWMNITSSDVYRWNWNPLFDQSLLDSSPLNNTIYGITKEYGGVAQRDVIIGSVILNSGTIDLFNRADLNSSIRTTTIVMASSAIPLVFPPIYLDGDYYVDGGTASNELIVPGIKYCIARGLHDITIDVIICSPPIDNITNPSIEKMGIFGLATRAYDIMSNAVFNHELYTSCKANEMTFPIYIYKPTLPYPGNMMNFDHEYIVDMFKMGLNITQPKVSKYCFA